MNTQRTTLRGGNPRFNFLLWLIPLCAFFAGAVAQEIATPASDGANASITVKKEIRMERLQMFRGGNVEIRLERVKTDNATGTQLGDVQAVWLRRNLQSLIDNSPASPPSGNREQVTVTIGGQSVNVTFAQWLAILEAFRAKWAAETPPAP